MEKMRKELEHDIKVAKGIAFLEGAERTVKEYEENKGEREYSKDYFTKLSTEAEEMGWIFLLREPYRERYDNLQTRLWHIAQVEEEKQKRAELHTNPGLIKKVLKKLIPLKPKFKGVVEL